jgi:hypothetical protein
MGNVGKPRQPPLPEGFRAEEPGSFCSRATPVVPLSSADLILAKSDQRRHPPAVQSPSELSVGSPAQPTLRPGPTRNNAVGGKAIVSSDNPGISEHDFWDSPPAYSAPPSSLPVSYPARPVPTKRRSVAARAVFLAVLVPALALVAYMLATGHGP